MNGEMHQICRIATAAKTALREQTAFSFTLGKYENSVEFQLLPQEDFLGEQAKKAVRASVWFDQCKKKGLVDVAILVPDVVKDRNLLGFSNMTRSILVCYFADHRVTYFTPYWSFDTSIHAWDILHTEHAWNNAPPEKPRFSNPRDSFLSVLSKIKAFAEEIGYPNFACLFQKAADILSGAIDTDSVEYPPLLPALPDENQRLFLAASTADVFGGMGSWNDDPTYSAHLKGLDQTYERLSQALFEQTRYAAMYAINEW